jgi:hypothetical protein
VASSVAPGLAEHTTAELAVNQAGHRPHPPGMIPPMMAIGLTERLILSYSTNRMFHLQSVAAQRSGFRPCPPAAGTAPVACTVAWPPGHADPAYPCPHRPSPQRPHPIRQPTQDLRLLQQRDVSGRPRHTVSDSDDLLAPFLDGDLALEGVVLLLATAVPVRRGPVAGPLDPLLERI